MALNVPLYEDVTNCVIQCGKICRSWEMNVEGRGCIHTKSYNIAQVFVGRNWGKS